MVTLPVWVSAYGDRTCLEVTLLGYYLPEESSDRDPTCLAVTTGAKWGWKVLRLSVMIAPCFTGGTSISVCTKRNQCKKITKTLRVFVSTAKCITIINFNYANTLKGHTTFGIREEMDIFCVQFQCPEVW